MDKVIKHQLLKYCGRYAFVEREVPNQRYVVACGYDSEMGEWNQGYYFEDEQAALQYFRELSGFFCVKCPNANELHAVCKRQ